MTHDSQDNLEESTQNLSDGEDGKAKQGSTSGEGPKKLNSCTRFTLNINEHRNVEDDNKPEPEAPADVADNRRTQLREKLPETSVRIGDSREDAGYQVCDVFFDASFGDIVKKSLEGIENNAQWLLGHARDLSARIKSGCLPGGPFDAFRSSLKEKFIVPGAVQGNNIWVLGDVHGDFVALEAALSFITTFTEIQREAPNSEKSPQHLPDPPLIILLGDLIDDGRHGHHVVSRIMTLMVENPARICLIAGNHDAALQWTGTEFTSNVVPAEYSEWLNQHIEDGDEQYKELAQAYITLIDASLRGLLLPDGTLLAHGGVPHTDLHKDITSLAGLNKENAFNDLIWNRLHPRAEFKYPNRHRSGSEVGIDDFNAFCKILSNISGIEVTNMIRGHDHINDAARYDVYESYQNPKVLTINTMGHMLSRENLGPYFRSGCVAQLQSDGGMPCIYKLNVPDDVVSEFYPQPEQVEES